MEAREEEREGNEMMTLREQLLALGQQQAHKEAVKVPGLGEVYVKVMTGAEAMAYSLEGDTLQKEPGMLSASLLVYTLCDAEGAALFTKEDRLSLSALPFPIYQSLVKTAQRLNALDVTLEDVEKNSGAHTMNGSGTALPVP